MSRRGRPKSPYRRCRKCDRLFRYVGAERNCGCANHVVLARCSECDEVFAATRARGGGRPRKTCDARCSRARAHRLESEVLLADRLEATRWWLGLRPSQRTAAMAFVASDPPPTGWKGGRQTWAYHNRAAFSCEQRVVSGVR